MLSKSQNEWTNSQTRSNNHLFLLKGEDEKHLCVNSVIFWRFLLITNEFEFWRLNSK